MSDKKDDISITLPKGYKVTTNSSHQTDDGSISQADIDKRRRLDKLRDAIHDLKYKFKPQHKSGDYKFEQVKSGLILPNNYEKDEKTGELRERKSEKEKKEEAEKSIEKFTEEFFDKFDYTID